MLNKEEEPLVTGELTKKEMETDLKNIVQDKHPLDRFRELEEEYHEPIVFPKVLKEEVEVEPESQKEEEVKSAPKTKPKKAEPKEEAQPKKEVNPKPEPKPEPKVSYVLDVTPNEKELMAKLVRAEAESEPYRGKVAVASVIINRVKSDGFANTVNGVIYDPQQFQPVDNGTINKSATKVSRQAVEDALKGTRPVGQALFFWASSVPKDHWLWQNKTVTAQIGNHVFAN